MNELKFLPLLALLFFVSATAHATKPEAVTQIAEAFQKCSDDDLPGYEQARDRALALDGSLRSSTESVRNRWIAKDMIQQCDRSVAKANENRKLDAEIEKKRAEMRRVCEAFDPNADAASSARIAAAQAAVGHRLNGEDRAFCKQIVDSRRRQLQEKVDAERARKGKAETEARDKKLKEAVAQISGDRLGVYKKYGLPSWSVVDRSVIVRAPRWEYIYEIDVGSSERETRSGDTLTTTKTARCTHRFDFVGDKLAKAARVGPGCRYE